MMHRAECHEARMKTARCGPAKRTSALASESLDPGDAIGRQSQKLSRKCAPAQGKTRDKTTGSCSNLPEPDFMRGSTRYTHIVLRCERLRPSLFGGGGRHPVRRACWLGKEENPWRNAGPGNETRGG